MGDLARRLARSFLEGPALVGVPGMIRGFTPSGRPGGADSRWGRHLERSPPELPEFRTYRGFAAATVHVTSNPMTRLKPKMRLRLAIVEGCLHRGVD